ncbi:MAG: lamin tail domain-containing protein, partial [Acidobacteria bacterium]|nr:lamin tail domain-containing protein [Acidobacteriota bacterium]
MRNEGRGTSDEEPPVSHHSAERRCSMQHHAGVVSKALLFFLFALSSLLALLFLAGLPASQAVSSTLVISEVQTGGGTGQAANEFIELYNLTSTPIDLGPYRLVYRSAAGTSDTTLYAQWVTGTITSTIPACGHYLLARPEYTGTVTADAYTGSAIAATGGAVGLRLGPANTGTLIDSVGWGTATNALVEGSPAPAPPAWQSIERRPGGSAGNSQDTDNNASDFQ